MDEASLLFASEDDIDHMRVPSVHERSEWLRKIKRATNDMAGESNGTLVSGVFMTVSNSSYTGVYNKMLIKSVNAWLDPSARTVAYVTTSGVPIHKANLQMGTIANAGAGMYAPTWKLGSRGRVVAFSTSFEGLPVENAAAMAVYCKTVGGGHTMGSAYDTTFQTLETILRENAGMYAVNPDSVPNPSWLSTDDTKLFGAYQHAPIIPQCDVDVYDVESAARTSKQMRELIKRETQRIKALSELYTAVNTHKSKIALGHSSESQAAQQRKLERLCMQEAIEKANGGVLLAKREVQNDLVEAEMRIKRNVDDKSKRRRSSRRKGHADRKAVSDSTITRMIMRTLGLHRTKKLSWCNYIEIIWRFIELFERIFKK